ncbi:hypothetical protein IAT38_002551 [Cryptococcus sp. DSM 104549]
MHTYPLATADYSTHSPSSIFHLPRLPFLPPFINHVFYPPPPPPPSLNHHPNNNNRHTKVQPCPPHPPPENSAPPLPPPTPTPAPLPTSLPIAPEPTPTPAPDATSTPAPAPAPAPALPSYPSDPALPPSSVVTAAGGSPNPSNPALDASGKAVEPEVEVGKETGLVPATAPEVAAEPAAAPEPAAEAQAETAAPAEQPPLPIDAPVPPSPSAADEPPPTLPPSAIPSAVPTPEVISTETPGAGAAEAEADAQGEAEVMEVDAVGEVEEKSSGKRAGEELEEERGEKRLKEDVSEVAPAPASDPAAAAAPAEAPAPAPLLSADGTPLPPPAWHSYVPPAPRPAGPTTPLTLTQHKYTLNAVRSLKKRLPDAYNFLVPVDTVRFGIPHYHQVIERPMDLGTVETKLIVSDPRGPPKDKSKMGKWDTSKGSYKSVSEVTEDVRQIWENSRKFNGAEHPVSLMAGRLEEAFEKSLNNLPPEPTFVAPTPPAAPSGPSTARRPSISHPPTIRRTSDDTRPKREIHPPPSKDLAYEDVPGSARKPKRRNDPQLQWAARVLKGLEASNKHFMAVSPFLYPVERIVQDLPDYAAVIKRPIDLNIIKARLAENAYDEVGQVDEDVRLMIANAQKFNPPGHEVHTSATQLLQVWEEKWRGVPPKQEVRDESEDPVEGLEDGSYSSDEDATTLHSLEAQVTQLNAQISALRAKMTKRRAARGSSKSKKAGKPAAAGSGHARKASSSKNSPGMNGNGHAAGGAGSAVKRAKKSAKEAAVVYRDDEEDEEDYAEEESEAEDGAGGSGGAGVALTHAQKQELAEKIGMTDGATLNKVITIIQQTTNLGGNNQEIELDIDSLPPATVLKLYNLVCRGGRSSAGPKRAKNGQGKKATGGTGKKAMGGVSRRSVNEKEEAERIKRMEAQLQAFESQRGAGVGGMGGVGQGYEEEESSSEEESSEEE